MTKLLLSVHVLAAIIVIGPVTVAASLFPRYGRTALDGGDPRDAAVARLLHRISRGYAVLGLLVPAFGVATAVRLGVLTDAWLLVSIGLTVVAALVLALLVLPAQDRVIRALDAPAPDRPAAADFGRLSAASGIFATLWAVVVVLMVLRPGSTTGA